MEAADVFTKEEIEARRQLLKEKFERDQKAMLSYASQEGKAKGMEPALKMTIEVAKEKNVDKDILVPLMVKNFGICKEIINQYVNKYW
jgi:protoheme ferro-lyase